MPPLTTPGPFNPLAHLDHTSPNFHEDVRLIVEALPQVKGPPEMEALMSTAARALGDLLKLMEAAPEPYMEANADIIREAWCSLEVVNLTGPPHNAPDT